MTEINDVILGRRIRAIRNSLKLDQKQFAKKLDITVSALSNWECGRNKPKEMFLEKIAVLGNTTVDEMMDREVIDYKQLYEQQKQRADEIEESLNLSILASSNDALVTELQKTLSKSNERADELEKRWNELIDVLKKKYEYYKVRADDESFGPIEQEKWRIAKHEMMMTLMAMAELQEDDNA